MKSTSQFSKSPTIRKLLTDPNIVGVAKGLKKRGGKPTNLQSVVFFVKKKLPPSTVTPGTMVPETILFEGYQGSLYRTDVVEVGEIWALGVVPKGVNLKKRQRPAFPGVSIGHKDITAGTFGFVAHAKGTKVPLIVSNNHVLANSNDAAFGDHILQPGPADGGASYDQIGSLQRFVPISFSEEPAQCPVGKVVAWLLNALMLATKRRTRFLTTTVKQDVNLVDAACAIPLNEDDVTQEFVGMDWGKIGGMASVFPGDIVFKRGRTTEVTGGSVQYVGATVKVNYGQGKVATFEDQILLDNMSQGGDSGSAIVQINEGEEPTMLVGLLFAGSDQVTIANTASNVLSALKLEIP